MKGLLLLFLLLSCFILHAQDTGLYFEKRTVQDGLSHNKINCIIQDQRGFIWLGTDDGLNRFDGKSFVHFRNSSNDTTSISGNIITDLLEDKEGKIWITTADGGLTRYDYSLPPAQQFRQYKHIPGNNNSIPVNTINTMIEDPLGYLWLGTSGRSVLRFDKKNEVFRSITQSSRTILDLTLEKDGTIWVGRQGGGIMKINPFTLASIEDERYRDLYAKQLPHVVVTSLYRDRNDHIWYGSWDQVVYRHNSISGKEEVFTKKGPYSFQDDEILSFAQDQSGRIWMGGKEKGLHIYDPNSNRFINYRHDPSREGSVADNRINCIFIDKEGRIWLGTNRGLSVNNPDKQQFNQQFIHQSGHPLITYSIFENSNSELWLGTSNGIYIRKNDGSFQHHPIRYKGKSLHVTSFFRDEDGSIYLGTDYSLFTYDPLSKTVSLLPNTEKDSVMNKIIDSRIVSIVKDSIAGHPVLLTSPYGHFLAYYDLTDKTWVSRLHKMNIIEKFNLRDNLYRKLFKAKNGTIWLASFKSGLGKWKHSSLPRASFYTHDPQNASSISGNNVYDIREDDKGNLWVSLYGGGLNYFDISLGKFTSVPAINNLVEGIELDRHGNVWMISNGHLHRYDPNRKTYESFDLPDLEKTGGVKGFIFRDSKGMLYVSGQNFIIGFNPDSIRTRKARPKVFFTDFQIFNKSFVHLLQQDKIKLNYRDNYFSFEFAAPDFSLGSDVRYSYMLEGFDEDWVDAGERNYASYPNLEGGDYVFKVRATNTPGSWGSEYASIRINIIPPFWKRAWFYIACAIILSLAIYGIYRYRINELLKRQAIRNKIAQDLHDNVGSTLSSISVYSQVAKIYHQQNKTNDLDGTLEKISTTSSEMISELNDTVWAINPRNDNMGVIFQRMDSFAKPLLASQQIKFNLHYEKHLEPLNLEMEIRKNFYLIFKEAVNNALKYSDCSLLEVNVLQKGNRIIMIIKDNGKGFDLSKTSEGYKSSDVYGGGNGLKNMQRRANEMKGKLSMSSEPGKGTRLELSFSIT